MKKLVFRSYFSKQPQQARHADLGREDTALDVRGAVGAAIGADPAGHRIDVGAEGADDLLGHGTLLSVAGRSVGADGQASELRPWWQPRFCSRRSGRRRPDMDHDDLLDQVLALARGAGADAADCLIAERTALDLSWRLGALEELERKEAREIGLRVLVGRRVATAVDHAHRCGDAAQPGRGRGGRGPAAAARTPGPDWRSRTSWRAGWPELDLVDPDEPSRRRPRGRGRRRGGCRTRRARRHQLRRGVRLLEPQPDHARRRATAFAAASSAPATASGPRCWPAPARHAARL